MMYPKEFFIKQFQGLDTEALVDRLAAQALTDEARDAILSILGERGIQSGQLDAQVQAARKEQYLRTGVTNQCDFCGKGLLGAFNAEGQKFCDIACFHTSRLRSAAVDITDEQALDHARRLKAGACPSCSLPRRSPEMHKSYFITSMVFVITTTTVTSFKCASCATRDNLFAALHCATLGWWSVKGLVVTPFQIAGNVWAIIVRRPAVEPSGALVDWARLDLAERHLQEVKGGKWSLRA